MSQASSSGGSPDGGDRKPRKQRRPPQRLCWPATMSQASSVSSAKGDSTQPKQKWLHHQIDGKTTPPRKRARHDTPLAPSSKNNTAMWVDKFAPTSSAELCVAPKKVKEIKTWIEVALKSIHSRHDGTSSDRQQQKLLVLVGSPGIGKSTAVRVIAKELHLSVLSWNESFLPRSKGMDAMNLLSVQQTSALDSFDEFLQQSGSGLASLRLTSSSCSNVRGSDLGGYEKSIILLEDLPNLYGQEAELQFRTLMRRHLQRSYAPTVLVFSDVSEGRHRPEDLERLIDPDDLYSNECTTIMQIHSVTKSKMKKILSAVTTQERCSLTSSFLEEIHLQSNGDMRQALMTLQLHATGSLELLDDNNYKNEFHTTRQNDRDTKLSTFHALGKLLYSKRKMGDDGRDCLAFDPEEILERSDLGVEGSLRFLEYHSGDFFTDIGELSNAYDYFSDAAELLGQSTSSHQDDSSTISPFACASSIAGRAVANTNFHPAPNRFRQFSKPKVFDVLRKGRQNQFLMDQLSRRLSTDLLSTSSTLGHLGTFVTDALPFLRLIVPYEIDPFVDHLYSVAGDDFRGRRKIVPQTEEAGLKEQEEILGMDDIAEYDSEDYGDGGKVSSKRKEEP